MTLLDDVVTAVDPELRGRAAPDPGPGRFEELGATPERRFVLEAVYEGYLMHYGEPRAFAGLEPDLRLLGGDALYALGLARLAESGDLEAVAVLADLISGVARAHAEGRPGDAAELWRAAALTLSGGATIGSAGTQA